MGWKKKPYWLKGGIIGGTVGVLVLIINILLNLRLPLNFNYFAESFHYITYYKEIIGIDNILIMSVWKNIFNYNNSMLVIIICNILSYTFLILIYALIGFLIGYLCALVLKSKTKKVKIGNKLKS